MTAGNGVNATTPFLPSTSTGGPDPAAGCNAVAEGQIGADMGAPSGSASPGEATYGTGMSGSMSMQNMNGPGADETTFENTNADASGSQSMQEMSGANLGAPTKAMNRDSGRNLPGQGNDHNWNPMADYQ